MSSTIRVCGRDYSLADFVDLSIPLIFGGPQPNAFGVEPAAAEPCISGELIGDTRHGGSCNFERYTLVPHCTGTHTECLGHITKSRISIRECLLDTFLPALLVTAEPQKSRDCRETYSVKFGESDELITQTTLEAAMAHLNSDEAMPPALIVRTAPNDDSKLARQYGDTIPPYFTTEAMNFILRRRFRHLLVDTPSIDRLYDDGKLGNHRLFWKIDPGSFETNANSRIESTITELIYVPNSVEDGFYLLNIQIAPFSADASPSRPLIFRPV